MERASASPAIHLLIPLIQEFKMDTKAILRSITTPLSGIGLGAPRTIRSVLTLVPLAAALVIPDVALASARYQRRDGVAGEIKYAQVCNQDRRWTVKAIIEASSEGRDVLSARLNVRLNEQYRTPVYGVWVPYGRPDSGYNWRSVGTAFNWNANRTKRFYEINYTSFWGMQMDSRQEILLGNLISARGKDIIDLGGVINMGTVPGGGCKTYDDGRLY
jgi:hypothetical protein